MKMQLKFDSVVLIIEGEDAGHAIALAERAEIWESDWNGKLSKKEKQKIEFSFLKEEELLPVPDPIAKLTKEAADASGRWWTEYQEHGKTKARVKELEEMLERVQKVSSGEV